MNYLLKDIDHGGVLPKEKDYYNGMINLGDIPRGYNQCLSEVKELAVEHDLFESANTICSSINDWYVTDKKITLSMYIAQAIASNPKCFKLVKG